MFKLGEGMTLGYPRNDIVWGFQGHRLGLALIRRGFELYEGILFCSYIRTCLQTVFVMQPNRTVITSNINPPGLKKLHIINPVDHKIYIKI